MLREIPDVVLMDTFYTLLPGLNDAASLGGDERSYRMSDEDGFIGGMSRQGAPVLNRHKIPLITCLCPT